MRITIAHARDATRTKLVSATITTVSYHNLDITAARVSDIGQKVAHSATFQKVLVDARIEATYAHHASGGGSGGAVGGNNTESLVMNAAASLAGLASAAGTTLESHDQHPCSNQISWLQQQSLVSKVASHQMVGNQLPFNFAGVQAAQIAAAARNGAGGGFSSIGSQSANADRRNWQACKRCQCRCSRCSIAFFRRRIRRQ